jgi:biotin operon repressor
LFFIPSLVFIYSGKQFLHEPYRQNQHHSYPVTIQKGGKGQEIASRFSISLHTVYRYIKTLEEAGIGYSIMEGYRLPPVMFTKEEAIAFLTAEKIVEKLTDPSSVEHYHAAITTGHRWVFSFACRMYPSQVLMAPVQMKLFNRLTKKSCG